MSIVDDLIDLFPEDIVAQPGVVDRFGTWLASGASVAVKARFEGGSRTVRDTAGQFQVSTLSAIIAGTPGFSADTWRFTIPSRFQPNTDLIAINVLHESDEIGAEYEEVVFP